VDAAGCLTVQYKCLLHLPIQPSNHTFDYNHARHRCARFAPDDYGTHTTPVSSKHSPISQHVYSTPIDNGIHGEPEVECDADRVSANFNTNKPWQGNLYVDNHFNETGCKVAGDGSSSLAALSVPLDKCGVKRERSVEYYLQLYSKFEKISLSLAVEPPRCVRMGERGHVFPSAFPHENRSIGARAMLLHGGRQDSQHGHRSQRPNH
jgi:hypothetical protein